MSAISFICKKCESDLEVDSSAAGTLIDCPQCNAPIEVPFEKARAKVKAVVAIPAHEAARPQKPPPKPWSSYGVYSFRGAFVAVGNIFLAVLVWALIYQIVFGILNTVLQSRFALWKIFI
jgi:DNA-directed RNA polymerase subunit RPC12/RpoP